MQPENILIYSLLTTFFIFQFGCADTNADKNLSPQPLAEKKCPAEEFNLGETLAFADLYLLMSRATHNTYEHPKNPNRPIYQKANIAEVKALLPSIPKNVLDKSFGFRVGMGSEGFPTADFIIRNTNGSEDEKIELLKLLKDRGLNLSMCIIEYPFHVFHLSTGARNKDAKAYVDFLKLDPQYAEISKFLQEIDPNPNCKSM